MAAMAGSAACHVKWIDCIWVAMLPIVYVGAGCMIQGIIWLCWLCLLSITTDRLLLLPTSHTSACLRMDSCPGETACVLLEVREMGGKLNSNRGRDREPSVSKICGWG